MSLNIENFPEQKKPLVKAILKFGNTNRFAKLIGVSRQLVEGWIYTCKLAPPPKYCAQIESMTDGEVTRAELRPDLFEDFQKESLSDKQKLQNCIITLEELAKKLSGNNKKRRK